MINKIFKKLSFPLIFSLCLAAILAALTCLHWYSAPIGEKWLGCTIHNSSDVAVYFSYLKQGADKHFLLTNLYAIEPTLARFDVVWSTLGIFSRFGLHPIIIHELARLGFSAALVFAVYLTAKKITANEGDARLATLLCFAGISTGWIHSVYLAVFNLWTPITYSSPDVMTEFAVGPLLFGGAHAILSLALLLTALRFSWDAFAVGSLRRTAQAAICLTFLFLFHPYFIFVLIVFCLIAMIKFKTNLTAKKIIIVLWLLTLSAVPAMIVYIPLFFDKIFFTHHAVINVLPLSPWPAWPIALLPFIIAFIWRARKKIRFSEKEYWLLAWIVSVFVCLLLPLPFKRKLTEGLNTALVLLTLPAWFAVRDWLWKKPMRTINFLMSGMFILAASLSPVHLITSQLAWISEPKNQAWFYQPIELFSAWNYLSLHAASSSVITSDNLWLNVWSPAYSGKKTYVAHDHETPDYPRKREEWHRLTTSQNEQEVRKLLIELPLTHLILTKQNANTALFNVLISEKWRLIFESGTVRVFTKSE